VLQKIINYLKVQNVFNHFSIKPFHARKAYMMKLDKMWVRFHFQTAAKHHDHLSRIRPLIFIRKEHHAHHIALSPPCGVHHHLFHPNKLHAFRTSRSERTTRRHVTPSLLQYDGYYINFISVSTDISWIINFTETERSHLVFTRIK
jgi:hypothetical protein